VAVGVVSGSHAEILRRAYPLVLSRALGLTRSLPEAEDVAQEVVVRALSTWRERGVPEVPEAWLTTVAANVHRDRLRKEKWEVTRHDALESLSQMSPWVQTAVGDARVACGWKDDLLRLLFACCHPALENGESAALCLATVVGFSTSEIAAAFVTEPRAMEQRLTRARKRLRERGDPDGAAPENAADRVEAVRRVIHLLFNEGYWASEGAAPIRVELCRLAIGLADSLVEVFADEESRSLLALLRLHDARRPARFDAAGEVVPLPEQDRSAWDRAAMERAFLFLDESPLDAGAGPFRLEAEISAAHCRAARAEDTDWGYIAEAYRRLEALRPTPAVRVNRAFAAARAEGPRAGLALLDSLEAASASAYPYVHVVRGTLLEELGDLDGARASMLAARAVARNDAERRHIERRIAALAP